MIATKYGWGLTIAVSLCLAIFSLVNFNFVRDAVSRVLKYRKKFFERPEEDEELNPEELDELLMSQACSKNIYPNSFYILTRTYLSFKLLL